MAKFKKGDKCRVIREGDNCVGLTRDTFIGQAKLGDIVTIDQHDSCQPWLILPNGVRTYCGEDNLELVEKNVLTDLAIMCTRDALFRNRVGIAGTFTAGEIILTETLTETKPKKTIMKKLNTLVKKLLDSKTQTLLKAGLINGDLERTSTGTDALLDILFLEKIDALVTVAEERIAEEEKVNN